MKKFEAFFDSCPYAFDGKDCILEEKDLGIAADIASVLTPTHSVTALHCFQGCPFTNTAFRMDVRIDGEQIKTASWKWLPNAMLRKGGTKQFAVEALAAAIPASRSIVERITVSNLTDRPLSLPISLTYRGRTALEQSWQFSIPSPRKDDRRNYSVEGDLLSSVTDDTAYRLTCSLDGMRHFPRAYLWENELCLPPLGQVVFFLSAHMGSVEGSLAEAKETAADYEGALVRSFAYLEAEVARIERNLPRFSCSEPQLKRLYDRSLVTYILCRWENPELCALPYYSTGSINGGCMCSYLWDYCGGLMLHPIYDPEGNKEQLRAYLRNDLTTSYALNPVTSGPVGPWYQINQEKIILMVYHHVLVTGDVGFLHETVGEKTVLEWMLYHAFVGDSPEKEVSLYDYGVSGNDHLELARWGNGPYNGIMPDLNARRYMNYMRVYELTCLAGTPDERLPRRAAALADKLKALWNDKEKWYDFIDADGNRDIRYTVQMFKFLSSDVIGEKEREGLISHLNETEFLSKFGLHSMSKTDPQYDQDDIDNGGGGICTHFTMQICAQLYETGHDALATDILRRVYWWGERMPYMGDSCAANMIANREDTPLQGDISSVACAQMIFYYIFGIKPHFDGSITVCPVKNRPATDMTVENVRLCGKTFSVKISDDRFTVICENVEKSARIGEQITI